MNLICDFIVIAIIAVCIYSGKKNGFIRTFFSFFGSIISFLLTLIFVKPLSAFFANRVFFPVFKNQILSFLTGDGASSSLVSDFSALSDSAKEMLSSFGIDSKYFNELISEHSNDGGDKLTDSLSQYAVMPIAESVGYACAFVSLFVVFSVLIKILVRFLDSAAKLPGFRFANSFLGVASGALQGCFLAVLFASFMTAFAPVIRGNEIELFRSFHPEQTILLRFFSCFDFVSDAILKG